MIGQEQNKHTETLHRHLADLIKNMMQNLISSLTDLKAKDEKTKKESKNDTFSGLLIYDLNSPEDKRLKVDMFWRTLGSKSHRVIFNLTAFMKHMEGEQLNKIKQEIAFSLFKAIEHSDNNVIIIDMPIKKSDSVKKPYDIRRLIEKLLKENNHRFFFGLVLLDGTNSGKNATALFDVIGYLLAEGIEKIKKDQILLLTDQLTIDDITGYGSPLITKIETIQLQNLEKAEHEKLIRSVRKSLMSNEALSTVVSPHGTGKSYFLSVLRRYIENKSIKSVGFLINRYDVNEFYEALQNQVVFIDEAVLLDRVQQNAIIKETKNGKKIILFYQDEKQVPERFK